MAAEMEVIRPGHPAYARLMALMNVQEDDDMVEYHGRRVHVRYATMLTHLIDEMNDHFGGGAAPNIGTRNISLRRLPFNERYHDPNDPPSDRWYSELEFSYTIGGEPGFASEYIAIDGIYFDLLPRLNGDGEPVQNYGETWISVYVPIVTMNRIRGWFAAQTGWAPSDRRTITDDGQKLVSFSAKVHPGQGEQPSFWVVDEANPGDVVVSRRIGSVQDAAQDPEYQHIHRGWGIFAMSMNALSERNAPDAPTPDEVAANLGFTLISARTFGPDDGVWPVHNGPAPMAGI